MRPARFTIAVIVVCLIAAAAVPPLRQALAWAFRSHDLESILPSQAAVERAAGKHAHDVYFQLAAAGIALALTEPENSVPQAKERYVFRLGQIASRFPDSPAAHLSLAVRLLGQAGRLQREEEWIGEPPAQVPPPGEKGQPINRRKLDEAVRHLRIASALSPTNSVPDFLVAYAFFATKEDPQADDALRSALAKSDWSLYSREIRQAWLQLYQEAGVPSIEAPILTLFTLLKAEEEEFLARHMLSRLASVMVGLGEKDRQAARNDHAIIYYQSTLHLGEMTLDKADSIIDGAFASRIFAMTSGRFISAAEKEAVERLPLSKDQKKDRLAEIRCSNFQAYLTVHRRADLAGSYARDCQRVKNFEALSRVAINRYMPRMVAAFYSLSFAFAVVGWMQAGYALALLVLVGLLSLAFRPREESRMAPTWRWWEWAALTIVAFVPTYIATVLVMPTYQEETNTFVAKGFNWLSGSTGIAATLCLLLVVVAPIIGAIRKRRRLPSETRLGRAQASLASFRTLLPPTFAVLLAVALALTIPAWLTLRKWAAGEEKRVRVGEVQYWKIDQSTMLGPASKL